MANRRTLVTGGQVLVGVPKQGDVRSADVLIEDGAITAMGNELEAADAERVDASGCFVLPGFVDSHQHLWQTVMRGLTATWALGDYFWGIRTNHSVVHRAADVYAGTLAGAVAALDSGTTTTIDFSHCLNSPEHADAAVEAITHSGIRARWCYGLYEVPVERPVFTSVQQRHNDVRRIRDRYFSSEDPDGLLTMGVALTEVGIRPWAELRGEFALANELDLFLTTHANVIWGQQRIPEIEWYHRAGLLGPNQLHSHANTSSDEELRLLAEAGAATCSTPDTEMQMGMGFPIFARAAEHGVTVGLGGDIQSNNSQDPFHQMRLALQAENLRAGMPVLEGEGTLSMTGSPLTPADVLHYATLGSAQTLGLGDVTGSLEVGKAADLVLLRQDGVRQRPVVDPLSTIVLHSGISEVDTVMVGGSVVKRGGRLVGRVGEEAAKLVDESYDHVSAAIEKRGGWNPPKPDGHANLMAQLMAANVAEMLG